MSANRRALARAVGGGPGVSIAWIRALHGSDVGIVDDDGVVRVLGPTGALGPAALGPAAIGADPELDALVTSAPGRALAALAADCVPVLLAAHDSSGVLAVGAVHSGRRGVALGVVTRAVAAVRQAAGQRQAGQRSGGAVSVRAVIGPAICGRCYEVPVAMRAEVAAAVPAAWSTAWGGTPALDLVAGVAAQLGAAGAEARSLGLCTLETPWLFSHRRAHPGGRAGGVVVIDSALSRERARHAAGSAPDGSAPRHVTAR